MHKVAFYLMGSKGFYVLNHFIKKFGSGNIEYIISSEDHKLQKDFYKEIEALAVSEGIPFFHRTEKEKIELLEMNFKGYKFAIGWKWLIKNEKNLIVLHDSLLPRYRGFAPLVNCLINGETRIGVSAIYAAKDYDKGDIIMQVDTIINYPIKIIEAIRLIEPLYFDLVEKIYQKICNEEEIKTVKQYDADATYSMWLDEEDYFIDWSWVSNKIKRFVDATGFPYDNAKAYLNNQVVKIIEAEVVEDVVVEHRERHIGKVIFIADDKPVVICGKGLIKLIEIRDLVGNLIRVNMRSRFK
ncbi:formyltransferase family protein [Thermospira aquatica]|uniref:Methionyl-tRNA formyltransferase n=1 Tax=Thermospira aquatica TaxID=2828656 RepID=A0AAX3BEZ9_9SPIR|nr:formyltransferase family protein [Thermospira aquatica]URA10845.1 hypothetical protein KDW03_03300 [Thermospira aquatica]